MSKPTENSPSEKQLTTPSSPQSETPSEAGSSAAAKPSSAPRPKGKLLSISLGGVDLYQAGVEWTDEEKDARVEAGLKVVLSEK